MERRHHRNKNIYLLNTNFAKSLDVKVYNVKFKMLTNKHLNYTQNKILYNQNRIVIL